MVFEFYSSFSFSSIWFSTGFLIITRVPYHYWPTPVARTLMHACCAYVRIHTILPFTSTIPPLPQLTEEQISSALSNWLGVDENATAKRSSMALEDIQDLFASTATSATFSSSTRSLGSAYGQYQDEAINRQLQVSAY